MSIEYLSVSVSKHFNVQTNIKNSLKLGGLKELFYRDRIVPIGITRNLTVRENVTFF